MDLRAAKGRKGGLRGGKAKKGGRRFIPSLVLENFTLGYGNDRLHVKGATAGEGTLLR